MAFVNRIGNVLKQTLNKQIKLESCASNPMLYQALRSMSTKLFVGGLSYGTDEQSLTQAFSQYGEVTEARIIIDRDSGRSRGFGFVTFASDDGAAKAMQAWDGQDLQGRRLRVNYATEKPRTPGYGGGGGGYGGGGYGGGGYGGGGGGYNGGGGGYSSGYNATAGGGGGGYSSGYNATAGGGGGYSSGYNATAGGGGGGYDGGNTSLGSDRSIDFSFDSGYDGKSDSMFGDAQKLGGNKFEKDDGPEAYGDEYKDEDNDEPNDDYANRRG